MNLMHQNVQTTSNTSLRRTSILECRAVIPHDVPVGTTVNQLINLEQLFVPNLTLITFVAVLLENYAVKVPEANMCCVNII